MAATRPSTWLITGASSGFGKSLALAALNAGHKVLGATRSIPDAERSFPEFSTKGGIWLSLDPGQRDSYEQFAEVSREHDVDVLVNSAGYAFIGGVEDTAEEELRQQMEVNFYGPLRAVRACLPVLRAKRCGSIVLISSGAGFQALPGRSAYASSKFAIEAMHESLRQEVKTFGIKVLIVEPGAFRTPFSSRLLTPAQYESTDGFSPDYKGTDVERMVMMTKGLNSIPDAIKGCPDKAATEILKAIDGGHEYLRMILGKDCVRAMEQKLESLHSDLEATRAIASNVDID